MTGVPRHFRASYDSPPDFTTETYRTLLELALSNYAPRTFHTLEAGEKFFVLRHDVDFSLNRALALAKIEAELGVSASYLVDPHSIFYNLAEKGQAALLQKVLGLGHSLGLHFDANFYGVENESELDPLVRKEAEWIEFLIGVSPSVLSFHNPSELHLTWQADGYGDLINAYSSRLMGSSSYISDSNGYWRFRQLQDVLMDASESCLQILVHPGWWQETEMPPRRRVFRASFGRAAATMATYDSTLARMARTNFDGFPEEFVDLQAVLGSRFTFIDYLWNEGHMANLFLELWRLHEMQLNKLCQIGFRKQWRVPAHEVNSLFAAAGVSQDGSKRFKVAFGEQWESAIGADSIEHQSWVKVRDQLIQGQEVFSPLELQRGCSYLATIVTALARWGVQQPFQHDGFSPLSSTGLPTLATPDGSLVMELDEDAATNDGRMSRRRLIKWKQLKARLLDGQSGPSES